MASRKKKKKTSPRRHFGYFAAGLVLPAFLAAGWHWAYGQQDYPPGRAVPGQTMAVQPEAPRPTLPDEELAQLRLIFKNSVYSKTLTRLDNYIKQWRNAPKVADALAQRKQRLETISGDYLDFVRKDVAVRMSKAGKNFDGSQFFVYADRNPKAQFVMVGFFDSREGSIDIIGADLISSGNISKGGDYFETPVGVYENMVENFSYRAMGTPNQEGWRGLGAKDMRVWDFGDQPGLKKYKEGTTISQMRLLMHSTDPDRGEPRLGRIDSKGCIRISHGLNRFLDTYSILDRNYEAWAKTKPDSWLLKKDRKPTQFAGKYLVIGDSSTPLQADVSK